MIREIRAIGDDDRRAAEEARIASEVARDRAEAGLVPHVLRSPTLLCGCVDPAIGPTVVRKDGSCCACSP